MTTTFDWVRHAESVANWANNKPSDSYTKKDLEEKLKIEIQKFQALEYLNVNKMKESGNFPLINYVYGIIQKDYKNLDKDDDEILKDNCRKPDYSAIDNLSPEEIISGSEMEKIKKIWAFGTKDVVNDGCITQLKKLQKVIEDSNDKKVWKNKLIEMKKFPFWLRNMITTNFLFQPTLTYVGMNQAMNLGKNLESQKERLGSHDLVISSPTVRTLMTGYIALMHCGEAIEDKTITIIPYTNEKENDTEFVLYEDGLHDFTNAAIHPDSISDVCELIKTYLDKRYSSADTNITFNPDKYKKYCNGKSEKEIDDIRRCDIKKFWTYVSSTGKEIFEGKNNVLSFCHGYAIDEVRKSAKVDVSAIYNDTCNSNKNNSVKFMSFGANTSIFRHKYGDGNVVQNKSEDGLPFSEAAKKGGSKQTGGSSKDYKNITCKNGEIDDIITSSLYDIGVVYIPEKIRGDTFLEKEDKVNINDDLMGLQEGSLRYDIAKITHQKVPSPYCKKPGYYKNYIEPDQKWQNINGKSEEFRQSLLDCDNFVLNKEVVTKSAPVEEAEEEGSLGEESQAGGRRTRRRKGKKTRKGKKGKKGKKTRKGRKKTKKY
jgi:hypothetical protein